MCFCKLHIHILIFGLSSILVAAVNVLFGFFLLLFMYVIAKGAYFLFGGKLLLGDGKFLSLK